MGWGGGGGVQPTVGSLCHRGELALQVSKLCKQCLMHQIVELHKGRLQETTLLGQTASLKLIFIPPIQQIDKSSHQVCTHTQNICCIGLYMLSTVNNDTN